MLKEDHVMNILFAYKISVSLKPILWYFINNYSIWYSYNALL